MRTVLLALLLVAADAGPPSADAGPPAAPADVPPPAPPPRPVKSLRPDGLGYCSDYCTCGCNAGVPCRCGGVTRTSTPAPSAYHFYRSVSYAPAPFAVRPASNC